MADPVALQARPPQGMTLGDMVNMANAVQQYQQAQQMNPMLLQQRQLEISRLQQLTPEEITRARAEAGRATTEANVAAQTADPRIAQAKSQAESARLEALKAEYGLNANQQDDFTKILSGFAYDKRLSPEALQKNPNGAVEVVHEAKAQAVARGIDPKRLDMAIAPAMTIAMQRPDQLPGHLQNMIQIGMSAAEKRAAGQESVQVTPSGQVIRITPQIYQQKPEVTFEKPGGITPAPGTIEINGVKYFVGAPQTQGGAPILTPVPAPKTATSTDLPAANTAPAKKTVQTQSVPSAVPQSKLVNEDMPVPQGGLRQMNQQQQTRFDAGQKLFSEASDINQKAADQKAILDSIRQNLSQAQSSRPGQLLRQGSKFVQGSEQLDSLLKDLAANQIAQSKVMGADTDAARQTNAIATGSADIDPKALQKIIERADATRLATQMYNQGLSAYKQRDPLNSAIHADRFQQAWQDNYDPRIFMVENINNSNMSQDQKQKAIRNIVGIAPPKELADLKQKATNIRRLQTGDF